MYLIDSHCHLDRLDLSAYQGDLSAALDAAHDRGVSHFLAVSVTLDDVAELKDLARQYTSVFTSAGVHPLQELPHEPTVEEIVKEADDELVVAIGETGLDYHYALETKAIQIERFKRHLLAAQKLDKPVIIHTRDAKEDTLQLLREYGPKAGGVLHCFTEDLEMARAGVALGYYISISGIVTFRNADQVREVAKAVPLDCLLVETDAPYLAPAPHRGKKCEPKHVRDVAEFIADLRGISYEELAMQTTANFFRLFKGARPLATQR
ncbi:TatD DNase family protein [Oceanospirillum multiglobuliferum]|uniref:Hydrolase TatD n=1 Tax=Oceanospirillum multiglobuliferum TaxID=64969 RepID=A0A1T4R3Q7_9GAMM|nr:TatD family hydrolase [Oceanospirillum multiglobuliferum]OPX55251.1 hydrolase TatD [Oceanospirillum multiglobuliferum]SKA10603.1 TatD DNase family protein [Oceanospirillum multiglobuliferum]